MTETPKGGRPQRRALPPLIVELEGEVEVTFGGFVKGPARQHTLLLLAEPEEADSRKVYPKSITCGRCGFQFYMDAPLEHHLPRCTAPDCLLGNRG